jgi:hypothetical protein
MLSTRYRCRKFPVKGNMGRENGTGTFGRHHPFPFVLGIDYGISVGGGMIHPCGVARTMQGAFWPRQSRFGRVVTGG